MRHERAHRRCCANIILAAGREGLPETAVLDDEGWNSFGVFGEDAGLDMKLTLTCPPPPPPKSMVEPRSRGARQSSSDQNPNAGNLLT